VKGTKNNIGIDVETPKTTCTDKKCPFHGNLSVRGQIIEGTVEGTGMIQSAVVVRERRVRIPKYERYIKAKSSFHAHIPKCITVAKGDRVKIAECRKLSKTISYVVVGKVNQ
jgi:small subunit ribosomal protein S17